MNAKDLDALTPLELGTSIVTCGIMDLLTDDEISESLYRHQCGDWGELTEEDLEINEEALRCHRPVTSTITTNGVVLIITTNFWEQTTIVELYKEPHWWEA